MPDQATCTVPPPPNDSTAPPWEDAPAFREIFLAHFPPEAADAFRQAGRHLYDAVLEVDLYELNEPWVRARVRALAADLRFTALVLTTLAGVRLQAGLTAEEMALAMKAESWAGEVDQFAASLEAAVGPKP